MKVLRTLLFSFIALFFTFTTLTNAQAFPPTNPQDGYTYIRGNHPRSSGIYPQYQGLQTALGRNIIFTDVIDNNTVWEDGNGNPRALHGVPNPNDYPNTHNHYQNILSEVVNYKPYVNAVSIWGDAAAQSKNAHAWGALFTARSGCNPNSSYNPSGVDCNDFDSQLVGLEVDVLNGGKNGNYPNHGKSGIQVVGFGNPNTLGLEIRSEDSGRTDIPQSQFKGLFSIGLNFADAIQQNGTMIATWQNQMAKGFELSNTNFTEGIMRAKSNGFGTGIILNNGDGGQIYADQDQWGNKFLNIAIGDFGMKIKSENGTQEFIKIDKYGGIYLTGDVYITGKLVVNGREL